jgi:anti-sigma B factor antagonist
MDKDESATRTTSSAHESGGLGIEVAHFNVSVDRFPDRVVVVDLEGEVDIYTAAEFKHVLLGVIEEGFVRVVIDATKVTFMDSTALGVFVSGERRLRPRGSLIIACGEDTGRLFEITGLDRVFSIFRARDDARRAAAARSEG